MSCPRRSLCKENASPLVRPSSHCLQTQTAAGRHHIFHVIKPKPGRWRLIQRRNREILLFILAKAGHTRGTSRGSVARVLPGAGAGAGSLGQLRPLQEQSRCLNNVGAGTQVNRNVGEDILCMTHSRIPSPCPLRGTRRYALHQGIEKFVGEGSATTSHKHCHGYFMHIGGAVESRWGSTASLPSARGQGWHGQQERRGHLSRRRDDCDCCQGRSGDQNRLHLRYLWQKQAEPERLGPDGWVALYASQNSHDRSKPKALRG